MTLDRSPRNPLRVGLAGLGTVGAATFASLRDNAAHLTQHTGGRPIVVTAVSARTRARGTLNLGEIAWESDARALATRDDVDVVVELIGGANGIAYDLCQDALTKGKHLVTANKAMLAAHGLELAESATHAGRALRFEAAVAGGIPIIHTLRDCLTSSRITAVRGILNGTCNYILTRMERDGMNFADALTQAQTLGYAEADPTMDVDGHDTAHKLALLMTLAWGVPPQTGAIPTQGLRGLESVDLHFARELDCRIRLLGTAHMHDGTLNSYVAPVLVPLTHSLAQVENATNAVCVESDALGSLTLQGPGAGGAPTASAVVADLVAVARCHDQAPIMPFGIPNAALTERPIMPLKARRACWYIRLTVADQSGVLAAISGHLRDAHISIESLFQYGQSAEKNGGAVPLILVTHETDEASLTQAVARIADLAVVTAPPQCLRKIG